MRESEIIAILFPRKNREEILKRNSFLTNAVSSLAIW
jgi:hypothetical protein